MSDQIINDYQLMTARQFNNGVEKWTNKVRQISLSILSSRTHSSGRLSSELKARLLNDHQGGLAYVGLGFRFWKYGAYREYGAGRGYIVKDGIIMRGYSAWSDANKRKELRKKKYSEYKIRRMRTIDSHFSIIKRSSLPWLDPPIVSNIDSLADLSAEYYGDSALKSVLDKFNKITIEKNYGKR